MKIQPEASEYLVLVYEGEKAINSANPTNVRIWAEKCVFQIVDKFKVAREIYKQNKPKKTFIGPIEFLKGFVISLGGWIKDDLTWGIPENEPMMDKAVKGAKILLSHAYELQAFPKMAWGISAMFSGLLILASLTALFYSRSWENWLILIGIGAFFAYSFTQWREYARFSNVAKSIRSKVMRSN